MGLDFCHRFSVRKIATNRNVRSTHTTSSVFSELLSIYPASAQKEAVYISGHESDPAMHGLSPSVATKALAEEDDGGSSNHMVARFTIQWLS